MTGGMARIYILGRNAPTNEPWPDVIGFSIIFIVSIMFMLGLEVIINCSIDCHSNAVKRLFVFHSFGTIIDTFFPFHVHHRIPKYFHAF